MLSHLLPFLCDTDCRDPLTSSMALISGAPSAGAYKVVPFTSHQPKLLASGHRQSRQSLLLRAGHDCSTWSERALRLSQGVLLAGAVAVSWTLLPSGALAVSGGGGLGTSLSGKDFSNQDLHSQKFYKADMRGSNFSKANLKGANLYGAFAKDANFKGADLSNAVIESVDFEGADLTGAVLSEVQATNARFKDTKVADTDWTDAILRRDVQKQLCKIASGTNPVTNVDTLESLAC